MNSVHLGKSGRGERENAIREDLKSGEKVPLQVLIDRHPKSSVYSFLKKLEKKNEGRFVKVEYKERMVKAFQLITKDAPYEEVELLIRLLSNENVDIRIEAAKDWLALASKYEGISEKGLDFLLDKWQKDTSTDVQTALLSTVFRFTLKASENGLTEVVDKAKTSAAKALEIAKNIDAKPELREAAWNFLILLDDPNLTEMAFELVLRPEEQEIVMNYVHREIIQHAEKDRFDARKRLYAILERTESLSPVYQMALAFLQEIRSPSPLDKWIHTPTATIGLETTNRGLTNRTEQS